MDKFKINKNGWLWKLHTWVGSGAHDKVSYGWEKVTLCNYFWQSLAILAGLAIIGVCVLAAAVFVLAFAYSLTIAPYIGIMGWEGGILIAGVLLTVGLGLIGAFTTLTGDMDFSPEYINKPVKKLWIKLCPNKLYTKDKKLTPKPPNLVSEYIKAKKAKWCPLVELVDYDKE